MEARRNKFSVAVVGDKGAGKTRLIHQYLLGRSVIVEDTAKGRTYQTTLTLNSCPIDADIVESKAPTKIFECDAAIFVFSTASRATFDFVQTSLQGFPSQGRHPIAIVGTKTDVDPQEVKYEDGFGLATVMNAGYFHTTTNNTQKVLDVFHYMLQRHLYPQKARPRFRWLQRICTVCSCGRWWKAEGGLCCD